MSINSTSSATGTEYNPRFANGLSPLNPDNKDNPVTATNGKTESKEGDPTASQGSLAAQSTLEASGRPNGPNGNDPRTKQIAQFSKLKNPKVA